MTQSHSPDQTDPADDRVEVMVTIDRPSSEALAHQERGAKYDQLVKNSSDERDRILRWLDDQGLADDVYEASKPTAFNLLFLTTTPRVAEQLQNAPGVLAVSPAPRFKAE